MSRSRDVSKQYQKRYRLGDQEAIFDFLKHVRGAIAEPWVIDEIANWTVAQSEEKLNRVKWIMGKACERHKEEGLVEEITLEE